jgi:hypothetical protein
MKAVVASTFFVFIAIGFKITIKIPDKGNQRNGDMQFFSMNVEIIGMKQGKGGE